MENSGLKDIKYLEPEEVHAIIDCVPEVSRHAERDILIIELMWQAGARVTEALTLIRKDIGKDEVTLKNLKQYMKISIEGQEKKVRVSNPDAIKPVQIKKELCQKLHDYCMKNNIEDKDYVFSQNTVLGHVTRCYIWRMMDRASILAGIIVRGKRNRRTGGRYKGAYPHMLRHSDAMYLLDNTGDIEQVRKHLGHVLVTTTQGYAYVTTKKMKKTIEKLPF